MNVQRVKFIEHGSHEILYVDYRGLSGDDFVQAIMEVERVILGLGKTEMLQLVDLTDSFGSDPVMEQLKKTVAKTKPLMKKRAVVGVKGVQKLLLGVINAFTKDNLVPFSTSEEALDWLVRS